MTRIVRVATEPSYDVHIGAGAFELARKAVRPGDAFARDSGLPRHLGFVGARVGVALPAGEAAKDWNGLDLVLGALAENACDRSTCLFVVGGGAALDVGGLAAALYARGIDVVYCPTTLLAMVDASVGGKTAINLTQGKNLVGVVRQPRAVYADTEFLASLPEAEFCSGLGEVLKSALIGGERFLARLERDAELLVSRDGPALEEAIVRCVELKARIVARDPFERGARRALNLGHTFAHAIEHVAGYGRIPHGVAVAAGIAAALELSARAGVLAQAALPRRVAKLAVRLGLPTSLDALREHSGLALRADELLDAMRRDKKSVAAEPRFVLLRRPGKLALRLACADELVERVCTARRAARNSRARRTGVRRARHERSSPRTSS